MKCIVSQVDLYSFSEVLTSSNDNGLALALASKLWYRSKNDRKSDNISKKQLLIIIYHELSVILPSIASILQV